MQFLSPTTCEEAVSALANCQGEARLLAGGTDLLVRLQADMIEPELIVDIKRINACQSIVENGDGFILGAAVPSAVLGEHSRLCQAWPGVVEAMGLVGSTQVQGRATLVGNLCNASPAADSVPAMVAASGVANVVGLSGRRQVNIEDIPTAPGKTCLAEDEMIESIQLPARAPYSADAYLRFIPRTEMDIAVVGAAVNLRLDAQGVCTHARVALGAVGPTVILLESAANAIIGTSLDEHALGQLQTLCSQAATPISDKRGTVAFRIHTVGVLARRAAAIAYQRARAHV